jgi:O-antigen ligase
VPASRARGRMRVRAPWAVVMRQGAGLAGLLGLQTLGPGLNTATYIGLSAWALLGIRQSIQALSIGWLLNFLNPAVFELSPQALGLRWLVVGIAGIRIIVPVLAKRRGRVLRESLWLLAFAVVTSAAAVLKSASPAVSVLKAAALLVSVGAILEGFRERSEDAAYWRAWFASLFLVVIVGSLPLYWSDAGYARNQRGFQGLLDHPQAYGIFLAAAFAWFGGNLLERLYGWRRHGSGWNLAAMVALTGALLVATESRTALIAVALGALSAHLVWARLFSRPRAGVAALLIGILLGTAAAVYPVREVALDVLLKWDREVDLTGALVASRGALVAQSWENFRREPWLGIGFGRGSVPGLSERVADDRVLGVPVTAPVEKGFLLSALLEETGVVGTFIFLMFLGLLLLRIARQATFAAAWMAMAAVCVNIGEAVLTSPGGMGLFVWLIVGYATTQRMDEERRHLPVGRAGDGVGASATASDRRNQSRSVGGRR